MKFRSGRVAGGVQHDGHLDLGERRISRNVPWVRNQARRLNLDYTL